MEDEAQIQNLLWSIAISSGTAMPGTQVSQHDRLKAFHFLETFKRYDARIGLSEAQKVVSVCIDLLGRSTHIHLDQGLDVTTSTKVFALGCIFDFVKVRYYADSLNDGDRATLRNAICVCGKQLIVICDSSPSTGLSSGGSVNSEQSQRKGSRQIIGSKVSAVLASMAVRDFPQRWPTFATDVLAPTANGGLWNTRDAEGIGAKMCLDCLSFMVEDCTDSDFNSKISTTRRNDVLTGLNELSSYILVPIFELLRDEYSFLMQTKQTIQDMAIYLQAQGRALAQMNHEERASFMAEQSKQELAGKLIARALKTMEMFCHYMPIHWITTTDHGYDFIAVFLHFLREPRCHVHLASLKCLEALSQRKLDPEPWFRLLNSLPIAVQEANVATTQDWASDTRGIDVNSNDPQDRLVQQLPFYRSLSRTLSLLLYSHVVHVTNDKNILQREGERYNALASFLMLMTELLEHPSGRVGGEQMNTWLIMLRDPQISSGGILSPFLEAVLQRFLVSIIKFRWSDVENDEHPLSRVMEASWDDKESYEIWMNELRSRTSQLFRYIANNEPMMAASCISTHIESLIAKHGGQQAVKDHADSNTGRLTEDSQANLDFEGVQAAFENILLGIPDWAMKGNGKLPISNRRSAGQAEAIRTAVRGSLSQLAYAIVSWTPSDVWLKFRRVALLQALRYYWIHEAATLANGIDALLVYISAVDEWDNNVTAQSASSATSTAADARLSDEVIGVRKKAGMALIAVSKRTPHLLLPWLGQLSDRARSLLSSERILNPNRMHLYEFLSCVATAIEQPIERAKFIGDVLSDAISVLESDVMVNAVSSVEGLIMFLGVTDVGVNASSATDASNVQYVTKNFARLFSAYNQILSVGKRCLEATKNRPNGGIPMLTDPPPPSTIANPPTGDNVAQTIFPDEGPVAMQVLAYDNPFITLWPRILPPLLRITDVILRLWHPEYQSRLLANDMQRFVYAISDDEVYMVQKQDTISNGGVFGEGGTAGSVVAGWTRRDQNLLPRWSSWLNELRHTLFQLFGLMSADRVLFSPEMSGSFPGVVAVMADPCHLRSMEHRHLNQYLKQFVEYICLNCPSSLYHSHLSPFLGPVFEHVQYRLPLSWAAILHKSGPASVAPLTTLTCAGAAALAASNENDWFSSFYARGGLFVGDLESISAEAAVEKSRIDITRAYCDVIQSALALKGDWGLVLANIAKEEQAIKKNDPSKLSSGPKSSIMFAGEHRVNADGTPRLKNQSAIEARQLLRINKLCHFLLLEDKRVASALTISIIDCLSYPDAYTCRRTTRICHRILENVACVEHYAALIGQQMFTAAVKLLVTEPKWMVGVEWDMIAIVRDIYCRLVLGQCLQFGGQGAGMQQPRDVKNPLLYEQGKNVNSPLQGGGILVQPSSAPQQILSQLPGISPQDILVMNERLKLKLNAKDQKDKIREMLRIGAESLQLQEGSQQGGGIFERAVTEESVLNQKKVVPVVADLPEKLAMMSQAKKEATKNAMNDPDADRTPNWLFG